MGGHAGRNQRKDPFRWILPVMVILILLLGAFWISATSNHGGIIIQKITTEITFDGGGSTKFHTRYQIKIDQPKWYNDLTFYVSEDNFKRVKLGDVLSKEEVNQIKQII